MDLLNQSLNSFSGQISDLSIGLNLDIFETNIVNLTILVGGIFYLGIHEGDRSYRDQLGRLYVPRTEKDLRAICHSHNLVVFEFFREESSSFDGHPIEVMHMFSRLKP